MVEGTNTSLSQGVAGEVVTPILMVGEVVTPILTPRVQRPLPPVGMEALIEVVMGADLASMLCGAGIVNILTPARIPYAPSAGLE